MLRRRASGFAGRAGKRGRSGDKTPDHPADADSARLAALPWLAKRDYSSEELRRKLAGLGYQEVAVADAIERLQAERVLDDARYCERYVSYQAHRGQGPVRVRHDLAAEGVAGALIEQALEGPDWRQHCRDTRRKRFGPDLPADWKEKGRQSKFLQYRGFSADHIRFALGSDFDPDDITDD